LVVGDIITRIDLTMSISLIVIPDPSTPSREHGLDAQQVFHLPWLEDPALRVDERNALTAKLEPAREIGGIEHATSQSSKPVHAVESCLAQLGIVTVSL